MKINWLVWNCVVPIKFLCTLRACLEQRFFFKKKWRKWKRRKGRREDRLERRKRADHFFRKLVATTRFHMKKSICSYLWFRFPSRLLPSFLCYVFLRSKRSFLVISCIFSFLYFTTTYSSHSCIFSYSCVPNRPLGCRKKFGANCIHAIDSCHVSNQRDPTARLEDFSCFSFPSDHILFLVPNSQSVVV